MYVDNIVAGVKSKDEAFELYVQSKGIFREGEFNLRKFKTNLLKGFTRNYAETVHSGSSIADMNHQDYHLHEPHAGT